MKVKNINGTTQNTCTCGSWLNHWKKFSKQTVTVCKAKGCHNKDIVGAHVRKDVNYDDRWYIVPFCHQHNHPTTGKIELKKSTKLIPANIVTTCRTQ
ncbi:MAG: hypothetical protein PHR62_10200 [Paludibacter sp.]|nr:hypothetical protein [Paludibacter sp.]